MKNDEDYPNVFEIGEFNYESEKGEQQEYYQMPYGRFATIPHPKETIGHIAHFEPASDLEENAITTLTDYPKKNSVPSNGDSNLRKQNAMIPSNSFHPIPMSDQQDLLILVVSFVSKINFALERTPKLMQEGIETKNELYKLYRTSQPDTIEFIQQFGALLDRLS